MNDHVPWRITHLESSLGWGGQERRILAELTGFQRRGSFVSLWAPPDSRLAVHAAQAGIPVSPLLCGTGRMPSTIWRLSRWLRKHRIQILNPHSSRDSWIGCLAGTLAGTPLVVRSRHFEVPISSPLISRLAYKDLVHHLITTSPAITNQLRSVFSLPESFVSTIPTGIDLARFDNAGPRVQFDIPPSQEERFLVGMIGIFRRAKGHSILLEAVRQLRLQGIRCECVFVGSGPMEDFVRRDAESKDLLQRVHFLGEREDIPEVMRSLDVLAMPSLHEGIPQVGLQALACGTPLVGSDLGGIRVIIGQNERGWLAPAGDPVGLASALRDALSHRDESRRRSALGRSYVEAEHGHERMLDRLEELYRRQIQS
ncbi:MAG: glycosyltransferase family 4 protein [Verrucomicrobia bacterium]|nr:glycosyltransferase family 4 protein [Verrucomicrobiota bacterium]